MFAAKIAIEPAQMRLVGLERCLVTGLLQPPDDCLFPSPAHPFAELVDAPRFSLQLVVQFLREVFVGSFSSRSTYSLSVRTVKVDPPDSATPAKCHMSSLFR